MTTPNIFVGKGEKEQFLPLQYANRHGLVAGATGTGKTVTLQLLAEGFSKAGVPVFAADVKGDLSGLSQVGVPSPKLNDRLAKLGITDHAFSACPTIIWDVFGKKGHPLRVTISEMGALLLSRLMQLSEAQEGVLSIAFRAADEQGLLLLDLKDLQAMLTYVAENAATLSKQYGNITAQSVASVQRALLQMEDQGADTFFGEPALNVLDFMRTAPSGQGYVNLLAADTLISSPKLYATFLLWMLSELYETLPEAGDLDKPKLVFFFDEAHLLFADAPKALNDKIEQVVRLVRSKGVGIYFITQNPQDIPEDILGQLGNRVQHALRAFTPKDQKAVKVAAQTFRANPHFDTEAAITELGVGEALVSFLQDGGVPGIVERAFIAPPAGQIGIVNDEQRRKVIESSPVRAQYEQQIDRESAYEKLHARAAEQEQAVAQQPQQRATAPARQAAQSNSGGGLLGALFGGGGRGNSDSLVEVALKSAVRAAGSRAGREIIRGLLGGVSRR